MKAAVLGTSVAVAITHAASAWSAPPSAPAATFVMSGNPHVPLAVVHGAVIGDAITPAQRGQSCGARQRWARAGSAWQGVDGWGHVTGTFRISGSELYDATACREVSFGPPPAREGALLYISADSTWREPASAEWIPSAMERSSLAKVAARTSRVPQKRFSAPSTLTEIVETKRFFEVPAAGGGKTRMAVVGTCGAWLVASLDRERWTVVSRELQADPDQRQCWRPMAAFDLTGDGVPEIVLRFIEGDGEWWGELVLQRDAAGSWVQVALSGGGSTA